MRTFDPDNTFCEKGCVAKSLVSFRNGISPGAVSPDYFRALNKHEFIFSRSQKALTLFFIDFKFLRQQIL